MKLVFCDFWDYATQSPGKRFSFEEVRHRLKSGGRFDVAGDWSGVDGEAPGYSLEVYPDRGLGMTVRVYNYDGAGSISTLTEYREVDRRLFLGTAIDYVYDDDGKRRLRADATQMVTAYYKPDGMVRMEIDAGAPQMEVREYRDVDVSSHWEELPSTIEDFERIGRLETFVSGKR